MKGIAFPHMGKPGLLTAAFGLLLTLALLFLAGCSGQAVPPAAGAPGATPVAPRPTPALAQSDPARATLPRDESPHGDLTEWWYYTGHLAAADGRHYGFELVFFQIRRGDAPPGYEAHFAVTDDHRDRFQFSHQSTSGEQGGKGPGFDLKVGDWTMQGANGRDRLRAAMTGYGIDLLLQAEKPAVLHDGSGLIDFGPYGKSYYYSRTRMAVEGTVQDQGQAVPVHGTAWMDHQWGNFIVGSVGGWDWFALQLTDGSDVMLSFNRGADNRQNFSYGSYVDPLGTVTALQNGDFSEQASGSWTSPASGIAYPSGWLVRIPSQNLQLRLEPTVKGQELSFGSSGQAAGTDYWEGDVTISGQRATAAVTGQGYVELTGYRAP